MTHGAWAELLAEFANGRLTAEHFHDRFLAAWRRARDCSKHLPDSIPDSIEDLFFTVENYCSDPALYSSGDTTVTELNTAVERARRRLLNERPGDTLT